MAVAARALRYLLRVLDSISTKRGHDTRTERQIIGERGEDAAFFHLREHGYTVVARNYRSAHTRGELDLVAWDGETLCFVEVKTRGAEDFAPADSAVDFEKRRDLRRIAKDYLRHLPGVGLTVRSDRKAKLPPTRFDIVSVYLLEGKEPQVELQKEAFGWG